MVWDRLQRTWQGHRVGYIYIVGSLGLMLTCLIHAGKTGQLYPWMYLIIFLPVLGSIVYLIVNVLPNVMASPRAAKLKETARDMRDPERRLRVYKHEAELSNSIDARQKLADEYLRIGRAEEGLPIYRGLTDTAFADDPRLQLGFARALVETGNFTEAEGVLDRFQAQHPNAGDADGHLLYARALAGQGKASEATAEYESLIKYFPGAEATCRYALYLQSIGRRDEAQTHFKSIVKTVETSPPHVRKLNKRWYQMAKAQRA